MISFKRGLSLLLAALLVMTNSPSLAFSLSTDTDIPVVGMSIPAETPESVVEIIADWQDDFNFTCDDYSNTITLIHLA